MDRIFCRTGRGTYLAVDADLFTTIEQAKREHHGRALCTHYGAPEAVLARVVAAGVELRPTSQVIGDNLLGVPLTFDQGLGFDEIVLYADV